jgi:RHS repeat-associated protein
VYTRDAVGRITRLVETVDGVTATFVHAYDAAGRLESVTRDGGPPRAHGYDANGNRTSIAGVGASYDAQDRLVSLGGATYGYSAHGTLASKTTGAVATTYRYDELGALLEVGLPGGRAVGYLVDGEGRRVGRTVDGVLVQGFLYQGARPVAELDAGGAIVSRFVYASPANVPDYLVRGGVPYRIVADHLGSPRLVVDATTGAVAQRLDYDELGRVTTDTNPGFQPFGFAGGLYDPDTGLTRFGARDYDAEAGRFTAKDPIGFAGGDPNLYGYAHGDPVNFSDPDGLAAVCRVVYVRSRDTRVLERPVADTRQINAVLQPGAGVGFLQLDPTGQWAQIQTALPDGSFVQGWVLSQNLVSTAPSTVYDGAGQPMSAQAYASYGQATKG